jgi:hypothetical protein
MKWVLIWASPHSLPSITPSTVGGSENEENAMDGWAFTIPGMVAMLKRKMKKYLILTKTLLILKVRAKNSGYSYIRDLIFRQKIPFWQ